MKRLTPSQRQEIVRRYTEEKTDVLDLAMDFDVVTMTIYRTLRKAGCTERHRKLNSKALTRETKERIARRYTEGDEQVLDIASDFGISERSVYRAVRDIGCQHYRCRKITPEEWKRIISLYLARMPMSEIARHTGRSPHWLERRLLRMGYSRRRPRRWQKRPAAA